MRVDVPTALTSSTLVVIGAKRLSLEEPLSGKPSGRGLATGMGSTTPYKLFHSIQTVPLPTDSTIFFLVLLARGRVYTKQINTNSS